MLHVNTMLRPFDYLAQYILDANDEVHKNGCRYPEIDWEYWLAKNRDVIGWVTVEGTKINFPVIQAKKDCPTYYLHHDTFRDSNEEGCIFLDAECEDEGLLSKNSVIFGHNLNNERGFSAFADYSNMEFAKEHQGIMLQTPDWQKTLKVICVEITEGSAKTKTTSFEDEEQYRIWLRERYKKSCVKLDKGIENGEYPTRIWTFCTCSYNKYEDERTLVYACEE